MKRSLKPRFSFQNNSVMSQPIVSFTIQHKGNIALKRAPNVRKIRLSTGASVRLDRYVNQPAN
jgi:hypothetical protein